MALKAVETLLLPFGWDMAILMEIVGNGKRSGQRNRTLMTQMKLMATFD
jgi:hypothetical protein